MKGNIQLKRDIDRNVCRAVVPLKYPVFPLEQVLVPPKKTIFESGAKYPLCRTLMSAERFAVSVMMLKRGGKEAKHHRHRLRQGHHAGH